MFSDDLCEFAQSREFSLILDNNLAPLGSVVPTPLLTPPDSPLNAPAMTAMQRAKLQEKNQSEIERERSYVCSRFGM